MQRWRLKFVCFCCCSFFVRVYLRLREESRLRKLLDSEEGGGLVVGGSGVEWATSDA